MQDVLDLLLSKGFSLQLRHEEKEVHNGFVTLLDENEVQLAHAPKIQIMFPSHRERMVESFVNEAIEAYHDHRLTVAGSCVETVEVETVETVETTTPHSSSVV
jgi:5-enolpyruvylshikimate-3-phosphate synthase